jgi:L-threonylcarbamoyladenylate synthase
VVLVTSVELAATARQFSAAGARVRCLVPEGVSVAQGVARVVPADPEGYARALYESLRALDRTGADVILVVPPEERGVGRAVVDRLERAAAPRSEPKAED